MTAPICPAGIGTARPFHDKAVQRRCEPSGDLGPGQAGLSQTSMIASPRRSAMRRQHLDLSVIIRAQP
jgi:hypothetical protein